MGGPNVFTIPPHLSFVTELADGILTRWGDNPQDLARVRVLLPTRRACRSLREAFLRRTDGVPMLLPHMTPLGDVNDDDMVLEDTGVEDTLDLPPTMNATARVVQLAQLVMAKDPDTTPEQAVRLAGELAKLIDQVHTEGLDLSRLPGLVHRDLAEHWQQTLNFLEILGTAWPQVLADYGLMDSAERRDKLIRARAKSWAEHPPETPIIAAGSTGTIPASAELLKTVAHLPQGFLVLPGLDQDALDDVWKAVDPTHPQYGMRQLLFKLDMNRHDVQLWGQDKTTSHPRTAFLSQALAPAEATHLWQSGSEITPDVLSGVERIDAPGPREEATAIALIMRETLETPEKTCALITPDRSLARRVGVELGRWGIEVDDSAGTPLDQTPPGAFFNLVSEMAASQLRPVHVLACLKHPLAALGMIPAELRKAVRALELALLRGPRPAPGLQGLEDLLRVFLHDEQQGMRFKRHGLDQNLPRTAIQLLSDITGPLMEALQSDRINPDALLELHTQTAARMAEVNFDKDERRLWAGDDGEALAAFIAEAHDALMSFGEIRADEYPALLQAMMLGRAVRPRYAMHPRLSIWGPLEARLQTADVAVLGGLNEGSWPPNAEASPWMSRPMMQDFGLPLPERRIGLSAHDFVQALHAREVYLTRSTRSGGSPQVPSRWLVRLDTLLGEDHAMTQGKKWLHWATQLTQPDGPASPVQGPRPKPPVDARPDRISVTQVETWIRDPYAIYARKVLDLDVLDDIEADPGAADRGIVIHEIMDRFIRAHMDELPDDPAQDLIEMGELVFDEMVASPSVRAFWWPRFKRIAHWFADFETKRRAAGYKPILVEQRGELKLEELSRDFTLIAKADRFDRDMSGGLVVMDYKTGQPPTTKQVEAGLTPQLPLEAAMAICGGFKDLAEAGTVSELTYIRLSGGRVAGEEKPIKVNADAQAQEAYENLIQMMHKYMDPDTPFLSRPRPMFESRFGDFDHLARVKEWSAGGGDA